jgi:hypothetical protein
MVKVLMWIGAVTLLFAGAALWYLAATVTAEQAWTGIALYLWAVACVLLWMVFVLGVSCGLPSRKEKQGSQPVPASSLVVPEPMPIRNGGVSVWDLVISDMKGRDEFGRRKYGTPLQVNNGRDPLVDAYQEALDLVVYLRQAIERRTTVDKSRRK